VKLLWYGITLAFARMMDQLVSAKDYAFFRQLAFRSKQQFVLARTQTFWPEVAVCTQVYPRFRFSLTLEARCTHFWRLLNFSVSYFRCFCNLLRHTSWLFLTYGKLFAAIGIFLLELTE